MIAEWMQAFAASGARMEALLRLLHVYSGAMRRIPQAEAEVYETEIEDRLRAAGKTESDLIQTGGRVGVRMAQIFGQTLLGIYRRHRQGDSAFVEMWKDLGAQERYARKMEWLNTQQPALAKALGV